MSRADAAGFQPRRGMNFGGALDGARGDDDGLLRERHYDAVREAGFDTVRLPVRWSAHLAECPPYAVDGAFFWERRGDRRRASTGPR